MKTPVAVSLVIVGGALMVATLFLDYRQHDLLREWLGLGIGVVMIASAGIFSSHSGTSHSTAKPTDSITDWLIVIVTFLGFATTIYMIYDAAQAFKSTNYATASPMILDLDKKFIEQPELRPYFYQDGTNQILCTHLGDTNYPQVMAMCEFVLDTFDSFLAQRIRYGHQTLDKDWTDWMKESFDHSPSLVVFMDEHTNWYRSGELYTNVYVGWLKQNPDGVKKAELKCFPLAKRQ